MKRNLTRVERLHKRDDIEELLHTAKRIRGEALTLLYKANHRDYNRVAFFTRRGFKNAVQRNRQKRILKEIYRERKQGIKDGFDFIFILSPGLYSYVALRGFFLTLLKRRFLLKTEEESKL
jgi:ribonuclease P protein component